MASGSSVNILRDVWIIEKTIARWPTFIVVLDGEFPSLDNFVVDGNWNKTELEKYFWSSLIEIILQIQIFFELGGHSLEVINKFLGKPITSMVVTHSVQLLKEEEKVKTFYSSGLLLVENSE